MYLLIWNHFIFEPVNTVSCLLIIFSNKSNAVKKFLTNCYNLAVDKQILKIFRSRCVGQLFQRAASAFGSWPAEFLANLY